MGLKDIEIKCSYDSDEDDILNSFYIPVLSHATKYYRLAGFFSSASFALAARGLKSFIVNGGQMKMVIGVKLSKADVDAIQKGIQSPEEVIEKVMIKDLNEIEDECIKNHVQALAWLIANKKLEVKVAVMVDEHGKVVDQDNIEKEGGIFHQKVGLFEDKEGNIISFSGSVNESAMAWTRNGEEFHVYRSWIDGELGHLEKNWEKFEKFWYNRAYRTKIFSIPEAVKKQLIDSAPEDIKDLKIDIATVKKTIPELRPYQDDAIRNWFSNNTTGIFEMATATGKTFVAIGCLRDLKKKINSLAVVITCPTTHLVNQWIEDLKKFDLQGIDAFGNYKSWSNKLMNEVLRLNMEHIKLLIIVTTHDTFSDEKFINIIKQIESEILVVADEVHWLGAPELRNGLIENYKYRIGLSATPKRWLDDEGSKIIFDYFGDTVYEFPLDKAIKEGFLTPYEYYPHIIELTEEEFYEYEKISKKIAVRYAQARGDEEKQKFYELLLFERQRIIKNAEEKMTELEKIMDSMPIIDHCLIYCTEKQIDKVEYMLNKRIIINHKFTQSEDPKTRDMLLKNFDKGEYSVLIAMKCLDEGVDVPSTKTAIIMASSGNPREFIQRRGRVLRKFTGKEKAIIHDFIVVPTLKGNIDPKTLELERKILIKEVRRFKEFAKSSLNSLEALNEIYPMLNKYNISLDVSE